MPSSQSPVPVLIGLGANLPSQYGDPMASLAAVLPMLAAAGIGVTARSPWYESEPVPPSDQPWYSNAVIAGDTLESSSNTLKILHEIETRFGRHRGVRNAARPLDLDLLAYGDEVSPPEPAMGHGIPVLPHPRLHERRFVLEPLAAIAPHWRHPRLMRSAAELLAGLPPGPGMRLARTFDAV
jgi:2-amino-4-hydroxy-6-hydroxymethyldihydropteridine diphosphokinase